MVNLRVTLKNAPVNTAEWWLRVHSGLDPDVLRVTNWMPYNQVGELDLPANWVFPAGFWVAVFDPLTPPHVRGYQNLWPDIDPGRVDAVYVNIPGVPELGNQTFDWAARHFEVEVPPAEFTNLAMTLARV